MENDVGLKLTLVQHQSQRALSLDARMYNVG